MGAPALLANLAALGVTVTAQRGNLIVQPWSLVSEDLRQALRTAKPALIDVLRGVPARPYRLTPAKSAVAHADPWDDAAVALFAARAGQIRRLGFSAPDAEDLAEQLHLRDVHADYRHLCLECSHYRLGRCRNHRAAYLATAELARDIATTFQHCPGYNEVLHG